MVLPGVGANPTCVRHIDPTPLRLPQDKTGARCLIRHPLRKANFRRGQLHRRPAASVTRGAYGDVNASGSVGVFDIFRVADGLLSIFDNDTLWDVNITRCGAAGQVDSLVVLDPRATGSSLTRDSRRLGLISADGLAGIRTPHGALRTCLTGAV